MAKELRYKLYLPEWTTTDQGLIKDVLEKEMQLSKHEISRLKFDGEILLNGKKVHVDEHMNVGDTLVLHFPEDEVPNELPAEVITPNILYEEEDFVAVNKPSGTPTHPSNLHTEDSMATALQAYYQKKDETMLIRPVGRLDQEVSGVAIYAKNQPAAARLNEEITAGTLKKEYIGYAQGKFQEKQGTIDLPIAHIDKQAERVVAEDGQPAITHYEVVDELIVNEKDVSKVKVRIDTGRTHQIRVHMKAIGHPLLGDTLYGGDTTAIQRTALHCAKADLVSPFNKQSVHVEAPLPQDLLALEGKEGAVVAGIDEAGGKAVVMPTWGSRFKGLLKWVGLFLLIAGIILGGIFGYRYYQEEQLRKAKAQEQLLQELYDGLTISFDPQTSFEYGSEFDALTYVKAHTGDISLTQGIDTKRLGKQVLKYLLTITDEKGNTVEREYEQAITVSDTQKPVITLKEDTVRVGFGEFFDPSANIVSIEDPVDGKLQEAKTLGEGKYVITSEVDNRKDGVYKVQIEAMDQNGNKETATYDIVVGSGAITQTEVTDTVKPFILIRADEINVSLNEEYNPRNNIIYVSDEVDGELLYNSREEKGSYTLIHTVNVKEKGRYPVKVIATDKAGNKEEDDFVVIVDGDDTTKEEEKAEESEAKETEEPTAEKKDENKDTTKPYILIRRDEVFVTLGSSYNPQDNIITINDDVDGDLPYGESEGKGHYTITHNINTDAEGTYDVKIVAMDKAGNKEVDDFKVTVREQSKASATFSGGDNASQIYQFVTGELGLNDAVACGILGHIVRESGYNPAAYNEAGYFGLCQWGGGRYERLMGYCAENGLDAYSVEGQLRFMQMELNGAYAGVYEQLKNVEDSADGASSAAYIFGLQYEVSGEGNAAAAATNAISFYNN